MYLKDYFIKATEEYNSFEKNVPAYYFRRSFHSDSVITAKITIAVCGFYELFLNGEKITKGFLSPYISNPNHFIYFDEYDVDLKVGENVFGVLLGNGFQNNPGGYIWDFDKADFRSAPMFAMKVTSGRETLFYSDKKFKIFSSPIRSDDYRFGEYYDANYEQEGWNQIGFDDSNWSHALNTAVPSGELRRADIAPIIKECEITPISIVPCADGYIYDFGISNAGVCRLNIVGSKGQKIELQHADSLKDNDLNIAQVWFVRERWNFDKELVHKDTYICKGVGIETYQPTFTYHGFRYVKVSGITKEQATEDLLTFIVYHTELNTRGDFYCSDTTSTNLQELTRRSISSNFHHFPTDCPQREKNGWTADAALSCEAALLNFDPERNYREWMRNICGAQRQDGAIPGIVPTAGWGFAWGNGPAWDCVLAWIPYYTYVYRGAVDMILESSETFLKYLKYLRSRCDEKGLLSIGLGDWCHVSGIPIKAPLIVTDSITAMDIANKISVMFSAVNMTEQADFAKSEALKYRVAIRQELVNMDSLLVAGNCQTSQAMALYYGVFECEEEQIAFEHLLQMIHAADDHIDVGVLGGKVLFHVLSKFGYSELAYKMIVREDFPSFGNWLKRGATTLWEVFLPTGVSSMNHHFWGDISAWFIKCIAGIEINPEKHDVNTVMICPKFIKQLDNVVAYHIAPAGKISVSWKREKEKILLDVQIPNEITATAILEKGFYFVNQKQAMAIVSGVYEINKTASDCNA